MSVLNKLAYFLGRRDEEPNQDLARELVSSQNAEDIQEIVDGLGHKNATVQGNCIKVLYEIGYLKPQLIAGYSEEFLQTLNSKNNRLVWGGMTALNTIAALSADQLFKHRVEIIKAVDTGSVITVDNGIQTLSRVAAQKAVYNKELFPYLLEHLRTCRAKEVPQHSEKMVIAVNPGNKQSFLKVLTQRMPDLSAAQAQRVRRVMKQIEKN